MSGNINKVKFEEIDGIKYFVKIVPINKFNTNTILFQSFLRQYISGKFNINCHHKTETRHENNELNYYIYFEYIDEKSWGYTNQNLKLIGKSMALIHNIGYLNKDIIKLDKKEEQYNNMSKWSYLDLNDDNILNAYNKRKTAFDNIKKPSKNKLKIPLHRDFKPHNILFDGSDFHLIDFDFAAIDYPDIEIMSFVSEILDTDMNAVRSFLTGYFENIDIPINKDEITDTYLSYLCANTFPFYMKDDLEHINYMNLIESRNQSFETILNNRDIIDNIIKSI